MDQQNDNLWVSPCCKTPLDKRVVIYFSRLMMSCTIMIFCLYQLTVFNDCETYAKYMSLLTFIIGLNFPSVKMNK